VPGLSFQWPCTRSAADAQQRIPPPPPRLSAEDCRRQLPPPPPLPSASELGRQSAAELRTLLERSYEQGLAAAQGGYERARLQAASATGGSGFREPAVSVLESVHIDWLYLCHACSYHEIEDGNGRAGLWGLELDWQPGELVMVVGGVGEGKSSLLAALLGLMTAEEEEDADGGGGAGGRSRRKLLGGKVAYCAQQPFVLSDSVRDNVLFGAPFSQARFDEVLERCCLSADLRTMPDGVDTVVGERGVTLSGGQKARLALARAAYADADVVLLDDVLAAVDSDVAATLMAQAIVVREREREQHTVAPLD
jgi:ABC-type multidrug transport system fused ATPase/permease subunit